MSSPTPPLSPEEIEAFREERRRRLEEIFGPGISPSGTYGYRPEGTVVFESKRAEPSSEHASIPYPTSVTSKPNFAGWLTTGLQTITLGMLLTGMFWLGALSNTVTNSEKKLDKLNDGIVGISKDSLSNRMIAIETKLEAIDKKLDSGNQTSGPTR